LERYTEQFVWVVFQGFLRIQKVEKCLGRGFTVPPYFRIESLEASFTANFHLIFV